MSHHFDSPTAIEDGRLNLCDVYAFAGPPGTTVLVLTVNPDAGRSSPTTLRPDAAYTFAVDTRGGTRQDLALRVVAGTPDDRGRQALRVLHAAGTPDAGALVDGTESGRGATGVPFDLTLPGGLPGRAWVGPAADPFAGNGAALFAFLQAAAAGRYAPEVFATPGNVFEGRNVTAAVLEVPDALFGIGRASVWATIDLYGHAPRRQVSRMGQPMLRPLFFDAPGPLTEALNAGSPGDDRRDHRERVVATARTLATLAGTPDPGGHAAAVADAFLPDVLGYTAGAPVRFRPGGASGRALTDDAFGAAVALVTGVTPAAPTVHDGPSPTFPYLGRPDESVRPPLAELFGLRPAGARPPAA